jgi:hypothetical protein
MKLDLPFYQTRYVGGDDRSGTRISRIQVDAHASRNGNDRVYLRHALQTSLLY